MKKLKIEAYDGKIYINNRLVFQGDDSQIKEDIERLEELLELDEKLENAHRSVYGIIDHLEEKLII